MEVTMAAGKCIRRVALFALLAGGFILSSPLYARDMQGRLGLGYNAEFSNFSQPNGVPGISLKYAFTKDLGVEGIVGIYSASPSNSVTAIKFFKNLFYETSLNFYFMAGGGLVGANNHSGVEFLGGFGAEAFIPGLESLGFSMETGGSFTNISGSFALKTIGVSFLNAGIHFYF
jgi:hypothetical protein